MGTVEGNVLGERLGAWDGALVGRMVGVKEGTAEGRRLGLPVGSHEGCAVGEKDGTSVLKTPKRVGMTVGTADGATLGAKLGAVEGENVGAALGVKDCGHIVADSVGAAVCGYEGVPADTVRIVRPPRAVRMPVCTISWRAVALSCGNVIDKTMLPALADSVIKDDGAFSFSASSLSHRFKVESSTPAMVPDSVM